MKITVYVPCHDNEKTVGQTLESIQRQVRPADQVLFIDDHCTDQSPAIARSLGARVVELTEGRGLAAGRNCALCNASGDVVLGVDADVVLEPPYLLELERRWNAEPEIAAIGGRLDEKFTDTPADLWRAVHMPQHHGNKELFNPRLLFGATMACRVEPVRRIGGWNEKFQTNHEDLDISNRLKEAGFKLLYLPACRALHLRRDTPESVLRGIWKWNEAAFAPHRASMPAWLAEGLPTIWRIYRVFRVMDLKFPGLTPVTMRMPWEWMVRDLHVMGGAGMETGEIRDLIPLARGVIESYGGAAVTPSLCSRLQSLIDELEDGVSAGGRLLPEIVSAVQWQALEGMPDGNYWHKCEPMLHRDAETPR
ncbi:MAG TPA: glycosyltransferase [Tepidisphaeraceae bacterium]|nr:glycosyltransferase [Tepidisphaeraceae bacterium]